MNLNTFTLSVRVITVWFLVTSLLSELIVPTNSLNGLTNCALHTPGSPICLSPSEVCNFNKQTPVCECSKGFFAYDGIHYNTNPNYSNDQCIACPPGKYKDQTGMEYFVPGLPSWQSSKCFGEQCCVPCPAGKFMFTNAAETDNQASVSVSQCLDCNAKPYGGSTGKLYTSFPASVAVFGTDTQRWFDVCFDVPTGQPTRQPSSQPTGQPTRQPSSQPTRQPTRQPTAQPSRQPSSQPTSRPSRQPSGQPTSEPSGQPTNSPTQPTGAPTGYPSGQPTTQPSSMPTNPTGQPSGSPTYQPTGQPTRTPTGQPSSKPSRVPTSQPTRQPTSQPTRQPTRQPTGQPTMSPSGQPTSQPSRLPSSQPSSAPSSVPTSVPTITPEADVGGLKVAMVFGGFWGFVLLAALLREYQQSKRLLNEKKLLTLKSSSVAPSPSRPSTNSNVGKNGRKVLSHGEIKPNTRFATAEAANEDLESAEEKDPRDVVRELLDVSLARIFEGVFASDYNLTKKLEFEIEHNHSYLMLIWSRKVGVKRWITALKLLTSLSVAALALCLVYDYHFPSNDGSCHQNLTPESCDVSRLRFDNSKNQCRWQESQKIGFDAFVPAFCTFNTSDDVYEVSFFIDVVLSVVAGMGVVNFILDIIFEHIIAAPATNKAANVQEAVARESLRLKYHKKVQAQLLRLNKGIIAYREELLAAGRSDEVDEFDAQWGVHLAPDGSEEIIWMDKISSDIYDIVKRSQELRVKLDAQSEMQCGTELLYLFAVDLLGRTTPAARIFSNKTEQSVKNTYRVVSIYIKLLFVLAILVGDGLILKFLLDTTKHKLVNWMKWVGYAFLAYVVIDFVSVEGSKIAFVHLLVPNSVSANVIAAKNIILHTLEQMCSEDVEISLNNLSIGSVRKEKFSASEHLFISTRVAKHFPGLFESAIVLSYQDPLPNLSSFYWGHEMTHSLMPSKAIEGSKIAPTIGISASGTAPKSVQRHQVNQEMAAPQDLRLREMTRRRAIQDVVMNKESPQSFLQHFKRSVLWVVLELSAMTSIEIQKLIVHVIQPGILYGLVQICYLVMEHIRVGIYVIVVLAVVAAVVLVLHLSHENAEVEAIAEDEELRRTDIDESAGGTYTVLQLADRLSSSAKSPASNASPNGRGLAAAASAKKRRPSFDSDDEEEEQKGMSPKSVSADASSLLEAFKAEADVDKKVTTISTEVNNASRLKLVTQKVVNIRSLMVPYNSKVVLDSRDRAISHDAVDAEGQTLLERDLELQEWRDEIEFKASQSNSFEPNRSQGHTVTFADRIVSQTHTPGLPVSALKPAEVETRGAESVIKGKELFPKEDDEMRFARSARDIEKEIEARLAKSRRQKLDLAGNVKKEPSQYNNKQLTPTLAKPEETRVDLAENSLLGILKAHGTVISPAASSSHKPPNKSLNLPMSLRKPTPKK